MVRFYRVCYLQQVAEQVINRERTERENILPRGEATWGWGRGACLLSCGLLQFLGTTIIQTTSSFLLPSPRSKRNLPIPNGRLPIIQSTFHIFHFEKVNICMNFISKLQVSRVNPNQKSREASWRLQGLLQENQIFLMLASHINHQLRQPAHAGLEAPCKSTFKSCTIFQEKNVGQSNGEGETTPYSRGAAGFYAQKGIWGSKARG